MTREHDVVVFGATGYTGALVTEYLAHTKPDIRWAIAGRDEQKLFERSQELRSRAKLDVPFIVASSNDAPSLARLASSARVVLSTVGPYAKLGEPLVQACIEAGTDYVDVTGEPEFVANIVERHEGAAKAAGVRLVPCAGFDSVPHDLGVFFAMSALKPSGPVEVEAFVHASGGFSGGTWQSALGAFASLGDGSARRVPHPAGGGRRVSAKPLRPRFEPEVSGWVLPMPSIDPQIVLRSAGLLDLYGPDFSYGHYVRVGSLGKAVGLAAGLGTAIGLAQIGPARTLLERLKRPGEGPSAADRERSFFRVTVVARTRAEKLIAKVSGGDAYEETAKMAAESAVLLATRRDRLPALAGVLTPAAAFGNQLVDTLDARGIRFEIVSRLREGSE
jgi:short subunit dehydrogenase-like uncharacterized protein